MEDGVRGAFCKDSPPHPHKSHFRTLVPHHQAFRDIIVLDTTSKNIVSLGAIVVNADRGRESVGMPSFIKKAIMWVAPSVSYSVHGSSLIFMLLDKASTQTILMFQPSKGPQRVFSDCIFRKCGKRRCLVSFIFKK